MNRQEEFKAFCETEKSIPLFLSFDWLNTVAKGHWDVAMEKRGEEIIAFLPYIINRRKGLTFIELPPLTPYGGIWIRYPEGQKYSSSLTYDKDVFLNLIKQLPAFDSFTQKFHPSIKNWMPFYWTGFSQTTWYTYILTDLSLKEKIFEGFRDNVRREIRKAEKNISVSPSTDISILYNLKLTACKSKGTIINTSEKKLSDIFQFCQSRNCGELLVAKDGTQIHSAALFVWDQSSSYYLYGASDPAYKTSGSMSLLLWMAIQRSASRVKEFNFEGSMNEDIERFFRSFGGVQTPYMIISKTNSRILKLRNLLKSII